MPDEAEQRILDLLDHAMPGPRRGTRVLDLALERAGLASLPETTEELKAFVRKALRETLVEELGMLVANEVANDLDAALYPALRRCDTLPAAPSSRRLKRESDGPVSPRRDGVAVLVVGGDRLRNASVARALAGHGFAVVTAQDLAEITIAGAGGTPDAIVLDERCALDPPDVLLGLLERTQSVAVHNCSNPPLAESIVRAHGCAKVAAIGEGSSARDLLRALTELVTP